MQNLDFEGFVTYLMQSKQKAEVALESSQHLSVWTHRKSELSCQRVLWWYLWNWLTLWFMQRCVL